MTVARDSVLLFWKEWVRVQNRRQNWLGWLAGPIVFSMVFGLIMPAFTPMAHAAGPEHPLDV